jgi:hypothetical protein
MRYTGEESNVSPLKKKQVLSTDPRLSDSSETRDILWWIVRYSTAYKKNNLVVETENSAPSPKSLSSACTLCIPDVKQRSVCPS